MNNKKSHKRKQQTIDLETKVESYLQQVLNRHFGPLKPTYMYEDFPIIIPLRLSLFSILMCISMGSLLFVLAFSIEQQWAFLLFFTGVVIFSLPAIYYSKRYHIIIDTKDVTIQIIWRYKVISWDSVVSITTESTSFRGFTIDHVIIFRYRNEIGKEVEMPFLSSLLPRRRAKEVFDLLKKIKKYGVSDFKKHIY